MKTILLPAFTLALVSCGSNRATEREINRNTIDDILSQPRTPIERLNRAIFRSESERADIVLFYSTNGRLRIDNGPTQPMVHLTEDTMPLKDWIVFFDSQPRKSMVVIILVKNVWSDGERSTHLSRINGYFTARGYQRIVIQQATSTSLPTLSDITHPRPPKGSRSPIRSVR